MSPINISYKQGNDNTLRYVKHYLKLGFNIIPLLPGSKKPFYSIILEMRGSNEWNVFVKNPLSLEEWDFILQNYPDLNLGVIAGKSSKGLVILDIDSRIDDELGNILFQYPTLTVKTARGHHYYYRSDKQTPNMTFTFGEFRANNEYTVIPPSVHESGAVYQFLNDNGDQTASAKKLPGISNITPLPNQLLELLKTYAEKPKRRDNPKKDKEPGAGVPRKGINNFPSLGTVKQNCRKFESHDYKELFRNIDIAIRIIKACGGNVKELKKSFACILPGNKHEKDNHPSAVLYQRNDGIITYFDFHDRKAWLLPEVFAAVKTKELRQLNPGEILIWGLRALHEIGEVNPIKILAKKLPGTAPESVKKLYHGFIYLLELRKLYILEGQDDTPFSWEFARNWCGIGSKETVSKAFQWLLVNGYIVKIKESVKHGKQSSTFYGLP
jgi:hypothetical protein